MGVRAVSVEGGLVIELRQRGEGACFSVCVCLCTEQGEMVRV